MDDHIFEVKSLSVRCDTPDGVYGNVGEHFPVRGVKHEGVIVYKAVIGKVKALIYPKSMIFVGGKTVEEYRVALAIIKERASLPLLCDGVAAVTLD